MEASQRKQSLQISSLDDQFVLIRIRSRSLLGEHPQQDSKLRPMGGGGQKDNGRVWGAGQWGEGRGGGKQRKEKGEAAWGNEWDRVGGAGAGGKAKGKEVEERQRGK